MKAEDVTTLRIALANLPFPATPEESVAGGRGGHRSGVRRAGRRRHLLSGVLRSRLPRPGQVGAAARPGVPRTRLVRRRAAPPKADVAVVLGTERIVDGALRISALVIYRDGTIAGFQDKVQLDPSEEGTYAPGSGRRVFQSGPLTFGVAICHEGWRYPETVRWAARRGAHVVFHPHFHEAEPGGYRPTHLRRSREHVPREGRPVPRRREHLLLRDGQLRERGLADDLGGGAARRDAARLPALRRAGCSSRRSTWTRPRACSRVAASRESLHAFGDELLGGEVAHLACELDLVADELAGVRDRDAVPWKSSVSTNDSVSPSTLPSFSSTSPVWPIRSKAAFPVSLPASTFSSNVYFWTPTWVSNSACHLPVASAASAGKAQSRPRPRECSTC